MISIKYYISCISIFSLLTMPAPAMNQEIRGLRNLLKKHEVAAQQYKQEMSNHQHTMRWLSYGTAMLAATATSALLLPKICTNRLLNSCIIAGQMGLAGYFGKKGFDLLMHSYIIPWFPSMRTIEQSRSISVSAAILHEIPHTPPLEINHVIKRFRERNKEEQQAAVHIATTSQTLDNWPNLKQHIQSYQPKPLTQCTKQLLEDITPGALENAFGKFDHLALKYQRAYEHASRRFRWPRRIAYCIPIITALGKLMHNYYEIKNSLDDNPQQGIMTLINIFSPLTVFITAIDFAFLRVGTYLFPFVGITKFRQRRQAREIERLCQFHKCTSDEIQRIGLPEGCLQVTTDLKERLRVQAPQLETV